MGLPPGLTFALLRVARGARNGAVYGAKVRFAHALVTAILFGKRPWRERMSRVLDATGGHAWALARFVAIYKAVTLALVGDGPPRPYASFIAGGLGGWLVFGRSTEPVAEQIVLYVMSRVLIGMARATTKHTRLDTVAVKSGAWQVTSALAWATVMALFVYDRDALNLTLAKSMQYLYVDSDQVDNFLDIL